jgi:hypothetical protein
LSLMRARNRPEVGVCDRSPHLTLRRLKKPTAVVDVGEVERRIRIYRALAARLTVPGCKTLDTIGGPAMA